jgi:hypothetical protein
LVGRKDRRTQGKQINTETIRESGVL